EPVSGILPRPRRPRSTPRRLPTPDGGSAKCADSSMPVQIPVASAFLYLPASCSFRLPPTRAALRRTAVAFGGGWSGGRFRISAKNEARQVVQSETPLESETCPLP